MAKLSDLLHPTEKQKELCRHVGYGERVFFGGSRGGAKTHGSLIAAMSVCHKFPKITVVIVRRHYGELEDNFGSKLDIWFDPAVFKYKRYLKHNALKFNNGSKVLFRAVDSYEAVQKLQGVEFQLLIVDEANQFEEELIHRMMGSLRNAHIEGFIPSVIMTGNPGGRADHYFKSRFIAPDYDKWKDYELKYKEKYVFIASSWRDNPNLDQESYEATLSSLPKGLREAWRDGNWDSFSGQFFSEWDSRVHTIDDFEIPKDWLRIAGVDEGSTEHPTVILWGAQDPSNGDVYIYREYSEVGVVEDAAIIAKSMMDPDEEISGWFADTSMFHQPQRQATDESSYRLFMNHGIPLTAANKNRIEGWRIVKQWLHWSSAKQPKLRFFKSCIRTIERLPLLMYDVRKAAKRIEDVDTTMMDDEADCLRYLLISGFGYPTGESADITDQLNSRDSEPVVSTRYAFEEDYGGFSDFLHSHSTGYERDCFTSDRSFYL